MNPRSLATTVRFEYGTSTSYGTATPEQAIGAGGSSVAVSAAIGGLKPGTKYNFRAVATSAAGITRGGNRTFTTVEGADRRGHHAVDDPPDLGQRA